MSDLERPELPSLSSGTGRGKGKQVFFLFMSGIVVAVIIFLLGVSVGKGLRKPGAASDTGQPGDTTVTAAPVTRPDPATDSKAGTGPAATASADTARTSPPTVSEPVAPPASPAPVADPPHDPPAAQKPAKVAAGEYSVQVGAYKTLAAARSVMASVKAKSKDYPVSVVTLAETDPARFRVYVGPYPTRADAESAASRLKKDGFSTLVKH